MEIDPQIDRDITHIYARMENLERLMIRLMPDEVIAQQSLDADFLRLVLEEKCGTRDFLVRRNGEVPGGFVVLRAIERLPRAGALAKLLDIPAPVVDYVNRLISLGAPIIIDTNN